MLSTKKVLLVKSLLTAFLLVSTLLVFSHAVATAERSQASLTHGPIVGGVTHNSATIWLRFSAGPSDVVVRYGTDPEMIQYSEIDAVAPNRKDHIVKIVISELIAGTDYYLQVLVDDVPQLSVPNQFRTAPMPGDDNSRTFLFLADFKRSDVNIASTEALSHAIDENAELVVLIGDIDHSNPHTFVEHGDMWKGITERTGVYHAFVDILDRMPVAYTMDDHDYGGNNTDKTFPWRRDAINAYRYYWPTYDQSGAGIWQSFDWGNVEFFLLDLRSQRNPYLMPDGPDKSMLGQSQKQWLFDSLLSSSAEWKIIITSVIFNRETAPVRTDAWLGYLTERQEVVDFLDDNGIQGVVFVSADAHAGAIDDGTNSDFPEMLVPSPTLNECAGNHENNLGEWSHGTYDNYPAACRGYGVITVSGDSLNMRVMDEFGSNVLTYTISP